MKKTFGMLCVFASLNLLAGDTMQSDENILCVKPNLFSKTSKSTKAKQIGGFGGILPDSGEVKPMIRRTCESLNCVFDDSLENKHAFFKNAALTILNSDEEISAKAYDYFRAREFELAKKLRNEALVAKYGCDYELAPIAMREGVNKVFVTATVILGGKETAKVEINGRVLAVRGKFGMVQDMQVYNLKIKEIK